MPVQMDKERQLGHEALLAMRAVAEAVDFARVVERDVAGGALAKVDASPVTIADFGVQALIAARLGRECPSDTLVAEEDASALRNALDLSHRIVGLVTQANPDLRPEQVLDWIDRGGGSPASRFWVLDPIDGTKGLLRGGQYVVALALIVDGTVQLGVLGCPRLSLDQLPVAGAESDSPSRAGIAVAVRGRGAWWSERSNESLRRLSVSNVSDPRRARVLHSFEAPHSDVDALQRVVHTLGVERPALLMDSQAKHAVIASGAADVLLRFPMQRVHDAIWDQAAGSVLIEEAGGRVTDLAGRALDFSRGRRLSNNEGLVATNDALHEAVLKAVRHARPKSSLSGV